MLPKHFQVLFIFHTKFDVSCSLQPLSQCYLSMMWWQVWQFLEISPGGILKQGWERDYKWVHRATPDGNGWWDPHICSRSAAVTGVPMESIIEPLATLPLYHIFYYCLLLALIISCPLFNSVLLAFSFPPMLLPISCENIGYWIKILNGFSLLA